ncbi:MAG: hypothetical protein ACPGRX_09205 [Bdellovibrionales bacterium]
MKISAKIMVLGACVVGLSACESAGLGNFDDAPPYAVERTAVGGSKAAPVVPAVEPEPVVKVVEKPVPQQCDYSTWESRVSKLESDLAQCNEINSRLRSEYRDVLRK